MPDRILHDSFDSFYRSPFGAIKEGSNLTLRISIPKSCLVNNVLLILKRDDLFELSVPMKLNEENSNYNIHQANIPVFERGLYFYYFKIIQPDNSFLLFRQGLHDTNMEDGECWQITCYPDDYVVPQAVKGGIMYQIFPDRFAISRNILTEGKIEPYIIHGSIDELPLVGPDENKIWNKDFYGGNFKGIVSKLDYLSSLGIDIIYLNPIFKARSNHRYDTADYMQPDPMLGSTDDFEQLCSEAGKRGINIILDGVFSHTGSESVYFKKAVSDKGSDYYKWYNFKKYPHEYDCWWDVVSLPSVNELEPSYLDFIIRNKDSVIEKWMRTGAKGFRLDVADELPDEFITIFRNKLKEIDNESFLLGEVWEDASNKVSYDKRRGYFTEGELDGVMNYPFRKAIISYVKKEISAKDFKESILKIYENYPFDSLLCSTLFLSSHDTERIRTELNDDQEKIKTAIALQTFLPGIMCIYYGDEIGMKGGKDPLNRCFYKETEDSDIYKKIYSDFIKLRKNHSALRYGKLFIETDDDKLTIIRKTENDEISISIKDTVIIYS